MINHKNDNVKKMQGTVNDDAKSGKYIGQFKEF